MWLLQYGHGRENRHVCATKTESMFLALSAAVHAAMGMDRAMSMTIVAVNVAMGETAVLAVGAAGSPDTSITAKPSFRKETIK